jgi:serine/threonine protein kinase
MFFRDQIIGKYRILSTIGSGGFGTVYLAADTWIDKKVALKVPHRQGVDFGEVWPWAEGRRTLYDIWGRLRYKRIYPLQAMVDFFKIMAGANVVTFVEPVK